MFYSWASTRSAGRIVPNTDVGQSSDRECEGLDVVATLSQRGAQPADRGSNCEYVKLTAGEQQPRGQQYGVEMRTAAISSQP